MEAVKLNVFHWHISDDQGFRVESKVYPLLQEKGSNGLYYTQEQVAEVIQYARDRGIRVVPEFDMPCHTTSWFVGYPQLASGPGPYKIADHWGVFDSAMDPTRETTFEFLDKFLGEMTALFPDAYFHVGGDECNGKEWNANPKIQAYMQRARHQGQCGPAILFHGARAEAGRRAPQDHGRLGRSAPARHAERCRHPVVARAEGPGRRRAPGKSRHAFERLLHRSEPVRGLSLLERSAGRRRRLAHS